MRGDSGSASKNTSEPIFKYPKYSNMRIFKNSLASDFVFVLEIHSLSWALIHWSMHIQHASGHATQLELWLHLPKLSTKRKEPAQLARPNLKSLCTVPPTELIIIIPYMAQILSVLPYAWRALGNLTIISKYNLILTWLVVIYVFCGMV